GLALQCIARVAHLRVEVERRIHIHIFERARQFETRLLLGFARWHRLGFNRRRRGGVVEVSSGFAQRTWRLADRLYLHDRWRRRFDVRRFGRRRRRLNDGWQVTQPRRNNVLGFVFWFGWRRCNLWRFGCAWRGFGWAQVAQPGGHAFK